MKNYGSYLPTVATDIITSMHFISDVALRFFSSINCQSDYIILDIDYQE